jgi:hypothetical protein
VDTCAQQIVTHACLEHGRNGSKIRGHDEKIDRKVVGPKSLAGDCLEFCKKSMSTPKEYRCKCKRSFDSQKGLRLHATRHCFLRKTPSSLLDSASDDVGSDPHALENAVTVTGPSKEGLVPLPWNKCTHQLPDFLESFHFQIRPLECEVHDAYTARFC